MASVGTRFGSSITEGADEDLGAPLVTAWELAQAWPDSALILIEGAGHSSSDAGMTEALVAATNRFAPNHGARSRQ